MYKKTKTKKFFFYLISVKIGLMVGFLKYGKNMSSLLNSNGLLNNL